MVHEDIRISEVVHEHLLLLICTRVLADESAVAVSFLKAPITAPKLRP